MATQAQRIAARKQVEDIRAKRVKVDAAKTKFRTGKGPTVKEVEEIGDEMPSGRRVLIGTVLGVAAGVGAGYGVSVLASYAVAAAVLYTASSFLAALIWVLGALLAVYLGVKSASVVFGYVVTSKDREHFQIASDSLGRLRDRMTSMWNNEATA